MKRILLFQLEPWFLSLRHYTGAMSFVVVIPHWPEKSAWLRLANSAYKRRHLRLRAAKHGFTNGRDVQPALIGRQVLTTIP